MNSNFLREAWYRLDRVFAGTILHPQYFLKKGEQMGVSAIKRNARGVFLDVGAGRQWYRREIEPLVGRYLALDHPLYRRYYPSRYPLEIEADVTRIPLEDGSVDSASMVWVLEHLSDPEKALGELRRVLKKGGKLVICTVENYPAHGFPPNYQRWTKVGLADLIKKCGFRANSIRPFGNFWESQAVGLHVYLMTAVKTLGRRAWGVIPGFFALVFLAPFMVGENALALILGRGKQTESFALGHVVVASKGVK